MLLPMILENSWFGYKNESWTIHSWKEDGKKKLTQTAILKGQPGRLRFPERYNMIKLHKVRNGYTVYLKMASLSSFIGHLYAKNTVLHKFLVPRLALFKSISKSSTLLQLANAVWNFEKCEQAVTNRSKCTEPCICFRRRRGVTQTTFSRTFL